MRVGMKALCLLPVVLGWMSCGGLKAYYYDSNRKFSLKEVSLDDGSQGYSTLLWEWRGYSDSGKVHLLSLLNEEGTGYDYVVQVHSRLRLEVSEQEYDLGEVLDTDGIPKGRLEYDLELWFSDGQQPEKRYVILVAEREAKVERYQYMDKSGYWVPTGDYTVTPNEYTGGYTVESSKRFVVESTELVQVLYFSARVRYVLEREHVEAILAEERGGLELARSSPERKSFSRNPDEERLFEQVKGFIAAFEGLTPFPDWS